MAALPSERARIIRSRQEKVPIYAGFLVEDHKDELSTGYSRDIATIVVKAGEKVLFEEKVDPVLFNFDGFFIPRSEAGIKRKMLHTLRDARRVRADYNARSGERHRSSKIPQIYPNS